jgi:16S rRNA (cytosine967-C5)-methyltransferase
VLDACAAPGNKTAHLLEAAGGDLRLLAADLDPERLEPLRRNLDRLGFDAEVLAADARQADRTGRTPPTTASCSTRPVPPPG